MKKYIHGLATIGAHITPGDNAAKTFKNGRKLQMPVKKHKIVWQ